MLAKFCLMWWVPGYFLCSTAPWKDLVEGQLSSRSKILSLSDRAEKNPFLTGRLRLASGLVQRTAYHKPSQVGILLYVSDLA